MFYTELVLPDEIDHFDKNRLAKYEYYIFIIVSSIEDYQLALVQIGPLLAACDALCFLIDADRFEKIESKEILHSLFQSARANAPTISNSFIAAISKKALASKESPQGQWFELFLSLEESPENKAKKLRKAIQETLAAKPSNQTTSPALVAKIFAGIVRLLLRSSGT